MLQQILIFMKKLEDNNIYSAVRKGFILIIPAVVTGALALLVKNFPIIQVQNYFKAFCGGVIDRLLGFIFGSTVGFMSAFLVLAISYYYSINFAKRNFSLQIMAMFTSLACFVASFGAASGSLTLDSFGTLGVFTAMLCGILATRLFFALFGHFTNKKIFYVAGADEQYHNSMAGIIPVFLCVVVFSGANIILSTLFGVSNFNDLISNILLSIFKNINNDLEAGLLFTVMLNFLWFFGVHAGNALDPIGKQIFSGNADGTTMISKSFIDNFAVIGGCGATLCLILAIFIVSKSKSSRQLAYSAMPTALFNINEIMIFGLPVVLNPLLFIPFVMVPVVSMCIAYGAMLLGIMPAVENTVFWTTPVFFSGYYATNSIMGIVVQIVIIAVGTAMYIPFVRLQEKMNEGRTELLLKQLTKEFFDEEEKGNTCEYINRHDSIGMIAKALVLQLKEDIKNKEIHMFYQPIVNSNGKVFKAEALLRWNYLGYPVSPPIVITLAKEDGCLDELTWCIIERTCQDTNFLCEHIDEHLRISINIVAEQLNDVAFIKKFISLAQEKKLSHNLLLEVTEETSLKAFTNISKNIDYLREYGVYMAIDDFGMGQTSLDYLRNNKFSYVKLDGVLVKQVIENERCCQIITSITELGKNLQFEVIAEYVETNEIRDILLKLGCHFFQGYFYSPALPRDELVNYYIEKDKVI